MVHALLSEMKAEDQKEMNEYVAFLKLLRYDDHVTLFRIQGVARDDPVTQSDLR